LIIHQCGSGIYHYPILHQKPTITIGTQCYDREAVALRLQQLQLSAHVPSSRDNIAYMDIFKSHIEAFEKNILCDNSKLSEIQGEIYNTMLDFDMENVIEFTLSAI
jgi:hypothetical protein